MPTLDSIYNQEQDRIDGFIKQFDGEAEEVFKRVQRIAQAQLAGISTDDILNYEFAWRDSLKQAGYYDLVNDLIDKQFDQMYQGTVNSFTAGGFDKAIFTADDAVKIQTLKNMKRNQFIRLADDVGLTVKRELYKYAISDASLVDMTKGIAQTLEGSNLAKYSKTYALTAIGEFQQELIDLRAKDVGDGVWVYVGVNDGATRQFCSNLLVKNETYTDEEKNELEGNPKRAYNCRHRFYKMKDEEAKASGYGERKAPEKDDLPVSRIIGDKVGKDANKQLKESKEDKFKAPVFDPHYNYKTPEEREKAWRKWDNDQENLMVHNKEEAFHKWGTWHYPEYKEEFAKGKLTSKTTKYMDATFKKYDGNHDGSTLYRGMIVEKADNPEFANYINNLKVGDNLKDSTPLSFSKDLDVAESYYDNKEWGIGNEGEDVSVLIKAKKVTKQGFDISEISNHQEEREVVIKPNTKFRITKITEDSNVTASGYRDGESVNDIKVKVIEVEVLE